jgi:hypothetical protein
MLGTKNQEQANPCGNFRNQKAPSWRPAPARCDGDNAMSDDLIYTQALDNSARADTAIASPANGQETDLDWSGWERWMRGHLDIEREVIVHCIVEEINELEAKRDHQVRASRGGP